MNNIMIDIETLGTSHDSVIVQIAAIFFDPYSGKTGSGFDINVSASDCQRVGLKIDADTVIWWLNQSEDAIKEVFFAIKPKSLHESLLEMLSFINSEVDIQEAIVWSNSPQFDLAILRNALELQLWEKHEIWKFRNERDVRTISALLPEIAKEHKYTGIKHRGLDDCLNQIAIVQKCYAKIFNKI